MNSIREAVLESVTELIRSLRKSYQERYGTAIFEIQTELDPTGRHLHLSGDVLLGKQKTELMGGVKRIVSFPATESITVLTEKTNPEDPNPSRPGFWNRLGWIQPRWIGNRGGTWGRAKSGGVINVFRTPALKNLSTQVNPFDDPFSVLKEMDSLCLIQLEDGTVGWVRPDEMEKIPEPLELPDRNRLKQGETVPVSPKTLERIMAEAKTFVGKTPYLFGGRSPGGVDCSGLIQLIFLQGANLIFPKHTRDQMRYGIDRSVSDLEPGDLLFARVKEKNVWHVAVRTDDPRFGLIHASLQQKKVIQESLEDFSKSYHRLFGKKVLAVTQP